VDVDDAEYPAAPILTPHMCLLLNGQQGWLSIFQVA
jgi:hypothetical protein